MSVEKFIVNKESGNFTVLPNHVIKGLQGNLPLLGFYTYLLHLPPSWEFYKTELMKALGMGINKLDRFLKQLERIGLARLVQRRGDDGRFDSCDLTILNGDCFNINNMEKCSPSPKIHRTASLTTDPGSYKRNTALNKDKQNKDKKLSCPSGDGQPKFFDAFWSLYPKKEAKKKALQAWMKMKLDRNASEIIEKLREQVIFKAGWKDRQYIPLPASWLNGRRWEDEVVIQPEKVKEGEETGWQYAKRISGLSMEAGI